MALCRWHSFSEPPLLLTVRTKNETCCIWSCEVTYRVEVLRILTGRGEEGWFLAGRG